MKYTYRVETIEEKGLLNLIFGDSKLPIKRMEAVMNKYGDHGWEVVEQVVEKRRLMLFWQKEVVVITFVKKEK